jgi:hypothetical protein
MPRPQIEFIQSQALPWKRGLYGGARPDVRSKILSIDRQVGDSSVLIKYPKGWRRSSKEYLTADEEIFVLEGSIRIAGIDYGKQCYGYLPAGYERQRASSRNGAIVLTFFSATPEAVAGKAARGFYDKRGLVKFLNTRDMPWGGMADGGELDPQINAGSGVKSLRVDPDTDDWTFLYAAMAQTHPDGWRGKLESHTVVEEMYQLGGDLAGDRGIMRPGAYFWRPPGINHGPYGSESGSLGFFRTQGGMLFNDWSRNKVPFKYNPRYRPKLPKDLKKYAREVRPGGTSY